MTSDEKEHFHLWGVRLSRYFDEITKDVGLFGAELERFRVTLEPFLGDGPFHEIPEQPVREKKPVPEIAHALGSVTPPKQPTYHAKIPKAINPVQGGFEILPGAELTNFDFRGASGVSEAICQGASVGEEGYERIIPPYVGNDVAVYGRVTKSERISGEGLLGVAFRELFSLDHFFFSAHETERRDLKTGCPAPLGMDHVLWMREGGIGRYFVYHKAKETIHTALIEEIFDAKHLQRDDGEFLRFHLPVEYWGVHHGVSLRKRHSLTTYALDNGKVIVQVPYVGPEITLGKPGFRDRK